MQNLRKTVIAAAAAAPLLIAAACSSDTTTGSTGTTVPAAASGGTTRSAPTTASAAPATTGAAKDIVATATAAGQFTTLASALTAAGLVETLQGEGPYTVFAPTDEAFAALPPGTVESLLQPANQEQLKTILTYHVVKGNVPASEVVKLDGKTVETVAGQQLTVQVDGDKVSLVDASGNTVAVVKTDVTASNGVIHVIDGVLMPKS